MSDPKYMLRYGLAIVAALSVLSAHCAKATVLDYSETGVGSGTFNGTAFTNATFTIDTTADTTSITSISTGVYAIVNTPTFLTFAGASPSSFTDNIQVVANTNQGSLGFGDNASNLAILFDQNSSTTSDVLLTPFGPVTGTPVFNAGDAFPTSAGPLVIDSISSVSFQATAVPEPASIALIGLAGVSFLSRRKRT
jgi:PEP-CTERM motif